MTPEEAAAVGRQIAYRIRAELVCCKVFERVQQEAAVLEREDHPDGHQSAIGRAVVRREWHDICYWGEAAARVAESPEQWKDDPSDWDWLTPDVHERRKRRKSDGAAVPGA